MPNWTRDQLVLAFELYCRTPFGRMHQGNPDIIALASQINRTPSAVAMKLSNFASLDPAEQARGIRGLAGASSLDRAVFAEFAPRQDALLDAANDAAQTMGVAAPPEPEPSPTQEIDDVLASAFAGPTESQRLVKVRRAQAAFRRTVLASYESRCAICELAVPAMLCASHIIPWSEDASRRADPTNGLALCALHDRAFDRGLIGVADDRTILVSPRLLRLEVAPPELHRVGLIEIVGRPMVTPRRFLPDAGALAHHRERVFIAAA